MATASVSQAEIEKMVRGIVTGADLSQMTGKVVREKVMLLLGERAGNDERALKRSIRDALKVVLASPEIAQQPQDAEESAADQGRVENDTAKNPRERNQDDNDAVNTATKLRKPVPNSNAKSTLGKQAVGPGEDGSEHPEEDNEKEEMHRNKVIESNAEMDLDPAKERSDVFSEPNAPGADDAEHDADDEDEDFVSPDKKLLSSNKKRRKLSVVDESDEEDDEGYEEAEGPEEKTRMTSRSKPVKRARKNNATTSKHLERLKSVCRQLGCNLGPNRLRGKTVVEQCATLVEHLLQKGVSNPTSLSKKSIAAHRARLEKDAELAALDTSNIIEDGPRSRRGRKAQEPKPQVELPSDFSGQELSEESAQDDDEDEYQVTSDDSE